LPTPTGNSDGRPLVRAPRNTREFLAYPEGLGSPFEGIEPRWSSGKLKPFRNRRKTNN